MGEEDVLDSVRHDHDPVRVDAQDLGRVVRSSLVKRSTPSAERSDLRTSRSRRPPW